MRAWAGVPAWERGERQSDGQQRRGGSLLAVTHSAVRTPDTCDGQVLNRLQGVGLWQNFLRAEDNRCSIRYQKIKTHKHRTVLGLKHRGDDDALR